MNRCLSLLRNRTADRPSANVFDHVDIVVPAHNEAANVGATIASLLLARSAVATTVTTSITIVADDCGDATVVAARSLLDPRRDRVVTGLFRNVGAARRSGTSIALSSGDRPLHARWVAHTDADTVVGEDWLVRQLTHAERGIVGVAGVVHLDPARNPDAELIRRFCASYTIDSDGTHTHVHGANIGMSAGAYLAAGGWRPLATGEDHDLWARIVLLGPVVRDAAISVGTDPRRRGRAPAGFADDIDRLVLGAA